MFKQVPQTEKVKALVAAAYGDPAVDLSKLAIFEAVVLNTKPLRRKGGLFDSATIDASAFNQMKDIVDGGRHIPLIIQHTLLSGDPLPVGKVFASEIIIGDDMTPELRAMFYLPTSEDKLVARINAGAVAEVSAGMRFGKLECSSCGWDYNSPDATSENIFECVCANGHVIGKDGVHLKLSQLQDWMELSVVDRGAVNGAKILPRPSQSMAKTDPTKLAARGFDDRVLTLFASVSDTSQTSKPAPKEPNMDVNQALIDANVKLALTERERDDHKGKTTALEAKLAEGTTLLAARDATIADLTAKLDAASKTDAAKLKVDLDAAMSVLDEYATAALLATGKPATALPETVSERVELIKSARASLSLAIPVGGASAPAGANEAEKPQDLMASFTAFRTPSL